MTHYKGGALPPNQVSYDAPTCCDNVQGEGTWTWNLYRVWDANCQLYTVLWRGTSTPCLTRQWIQVGAWETGEAYIIWQFFSLA